MLFRSVLVEAAVFLLPLFIIAVSTIALDVEYGLAVGMVLSILVLIWRSNVPTITVLGSFANLDIYTDVSNTDVSRMHKASQL